MSDLLEKVDEPLSTKKNRFSQKIIYLSLVTATAIVAASISIVIIHSQNHSAWREKALSGQVAMTQSQLVGLVNDEKISAYWAGPRVGYFYTLDNTVKNRSIISYVEANPPAEKAPLNTRLIATYYSKGAFTNSVLAAGKSGNTGFRNEDGSVVFYQATRKTDVYLAFPKSDYQIEIYDSTMGQALSLAILKDQITRIGA